MVLLKNVQAAKKAWRTIRKKKYIPRFELAETYLTREMEEVIKQLKEVR